jgi:cation:H+ antiporter
VLIGYIGLLLLALVVILAGAELFTNALEHVGQRLNLSEGLVGSVLAAVATALPETVVPVIAVFFGGADRAVREDIGVGAILGSPLMLITLAMALIGLFTGMQRGWNTPLKPEISGVLRDLGYFLVAYAIALIGLYVPRPSGGIHAMAGFCLVFLYAYYVYNTVQASSMLVTKGHGTRADSPLHLHHLGLPHAPLWEACQLLIGLALIIGGAKLFVIGVEAVGAATGISALILSLVIIPIATEMPEKFNSILWVRRGKDTLAFGNVTGAMVFQGTLLPAFGLQLSAWTPGYQVLWAMGLSFAAALWTLFLALRRKLTPLALMVNGSLYVLFFLVIIRS